jgi:hypothetical protein
VLLDVELEPPLPVVELEAALMVVLLELAGDDATELVPPAPLLAAAPPALALEGVAPY